MLSVLPSWDSWIAKAALELFPGRALFVAKLTRKGQPDPEDKGRLAALVAKRNGVLAIIPAGCELPPGMDHLPDIRITVMPPDLPVLRHVARRCLTGNARSLRAVPTQTNLVSLAVCFSPGASVRSAKTRLDRLERTSLEAKAVLPPLSSVSGLDAAKTWGNDLKSDLAAYRRGEIAFSSIDAGAVLAGPTGVGKTMVAQIIAAECGLAFYPTSIGELFASSDGDLGAVVKRARQIFTQAQAAAPALLFIDELDALPSRSTLTAHGKDWWTPVITEFLTQLDSLMTDREGIVVLGATNRYADLDPALVRPGRLARRLEITPPSAQDLAGIFRHHLRQDLFGVDLMPLGREAAGATGAQAAEWVHAAKRVARNAGRALTIEDLWDVVIGPETRSTDHLRRTAIHEAGHCIVGHDVGLTPDHVTIRRQGDRGGTTTLLPVATPMTHDDVEKLVVMLLGGLAAEAVVLGDGAWSLGAGGPKGSDLHLATELVAAGHVAHGAGKSLLWRASPDQATALLFSDPVLRRHIDEDLRRLLARAESLVRDSRSRCERLATRLIRDKSLSGETLRRMLRKREL